MNDAERCWEILPKVSRNFCLCIKLLPRPIDERMMLAYLVFRFIDTIEDSSISLPQKKEFFDQFVNLLQEESTSEKKIDLFKLRVKNELTYSYEAPLIENLDSIFRLYFRTPSPDRKSLEKYSALMATGMYHYLNTPIRDFKDQDDYCYYVAGVVAQLFNEYFFNNGRMSKEDCFSLMGLAKDYGLALQKVNILRDIANDVPQKRHYWPKNLLESFGIDSYEKIVLPENMPKSLLVLSEMTRDAWKYLRKGLLYIKSLGKAQLQIRVFCLVPFFMAVEHLEKCVDQKEVFLKGKKAKLSKFSIGMILFRSYFFGYQNRYLENWFYSYSHAKV